MCFGSLSPSPCYSQRSYVTHTHTQVKVPHLVFPPDSKGSSGFQQQPALQLHLLRAGL